MHLYRVKVGQKVTWNDPAITDYPVEDRAEVLARVFTVTSIDEDIITIEDEVTVAEVYARELRLVAPDYTLVDSAREISDDDFRDYCLDNNLIPCDENRYEYENDVRAMELDDFYANIKGSSKCDIPVMITGTLGLWNGEKEIVPVRSENVYNAIQKCLGRDCDSLVVAMKDGRLQVSVSHHDGTNVFYIQPLSKKGLKKFTDEFQFEYVEYFKDYLY